MCDEILSAHYGNRRVKSRASNNFPGPPGERSKRMPSTCRRFHDAPGCALTHSPSFPRSRAFEPPPRIVVMLRRAARALAASAASAAPRPAPRTFSSSSARATTVLCVRKDDEVVLMADGQVTLGSHVVKPNVKKVRRLQAGVIGGFAGATADAFTLFERLEMKLEEHPGQLTRAAVELAKAWRNDKYLRRLEATMVVADKDHTFQITGGGDVIEPHDGVIAIGSGGPVANAAARALVDVPGMDAAAIAMKAMNIAADTCVYTNHNFVIETLPGPAGGEGEEEKEAGEKKPTEKKSK
jgi:ATP-dependent HslUV protease subunit HslV